jgi:hypothetical protein
MRLILSAAVEGALLRENKDKTNTRYYGRLHES